ncbi:YheU family protein [Corallincola holothuriorum]|uniref:YheU family protein n=1 Tax=Corallincola holothuriorum TaxID=2282215 RepID=A0A368MZX2_9GAMM|nr:YheU family protein [Corallincola holothuriorum]RCU43778.1 YheU family protein [Corallincola holothuriorum]
MIIPYQQLAPNTLESILESYALREGTDYGIDEVPLQHKVEQLMQQLQHGDLLLVWSELHETINLMSKQSWQQLQQEASTTQAFNEDSSS